MNLSRRIETESPNKRMHRMTDPPRGLVAGAVGSLRAPTSVAGFRSVIGDPDRSLI